METPIEISQIQHQDSIWTWSGKGGKVSIWIPYLIRVEKILRQKWTWTIFYQGGAVIVDLRTVDTLMLYGDSDANIPVSFLDDITENGVVIVFHRRNKARPLWIWPSAVMDRQDLLTRQVKCRENSTKKSYVARRLISARVSGMAWLSQPMIDLEWHLSRARSITQIRQIEAAQTARFWRQYFEQLGVSEIRRDDGPIQRSLDACSVFLTGILMRWALFHRFAVTHGFMHEPTGYPALIYDLVEPYRGWLEQAVFRAAKARGVSDEKVLIGASISALKEHLQEEVWVPAFQVAVKRKNLLHGIVLALRSYLLGETARFVIPVEGERAGGRPIKAAFALPGARKTKTLPKKGF